MSSLKHAVKRRVHLERQAPINRERKQEFKNRIQKWHERQKLLGKLREKARFANPEEFHFGMLDCKMINGKLVKKDSKDEASLAQIDKMRVVLQREELRLIKIAERDKSVLTGVDAAEHLKRNHVIFLDSDVEKDDGYHDDTD